MKKKNLTYLESVHRDGKIWGIALCLIVFAFPVAVSIVFGAVPKWEALAKAMFATVPTASPKSAQVAITRVLLIAE